MTHRRKPLSQTPVSATRALPVPLSVIRQLPKTDLHLHLDGSLRVETLIDLARNQGVQLPSYTPEGLYALVFKETYRDLREYLTGFQYTVAVLQDTESLERVAYELMEDNIQEGVRYVEVRFAPQLHIRDGQDYGQVLRAVTQGLARAASEANQKSEAIRQGLEPPFAFGIIACAMRKFEPVYSHYFGRIFQVMAFAPFRDIYRTASLELARAAVHCRDHLGLPIVGFDLAGDERGYPAIDHRESYAYAHKHFMKKTVHAGEAYGPESIFQAITDLYADRIGHGYALYHPEMLQSEHITEKERYLNDLAEFISDRRITIEVCLSSNMQTVPGLARLSDHTFARMLKDRLSCSMCTDNRLVSRTSVTREIELAMANFAMTVEDLRNILIYGFKRSFFPGPYTEKREYTRCAIDVINRLLLPYRNGGGQ